MAGVDGQPDLLADPLVHDGRVTNIWIANVIEQLVRRSDVQRGMRTG